MPDRYETLRSQLIDWITPLCRSQWLTATDCASLNQDLLVRPDDLFDTAQQASRPIVVALFGGTGVGKSSLLNRLAGAEVARVGMMRPTSRELTLYLHDEANLAQLPEAAPVQRVAIDRHTNADDKYIAWIDMPDMDSTDHDNRTLALSWLSYVDLVIYVVSPERYRDDKGWQVLLQRGQQHGWIFIINHWDHGDPLQRDDFRAILTKAGFVDPIILVTCSQPSACTTSADELTLLRNHIHQLIDEQAVVTFSQRHNGFRLDHWQALLASITTRFQDDEKFNTLSTKWQISWQQTTQELAQGLAWSAQETANQIARLAAPPQAGLVARLLHIQSHTTSALASDDIERVCARFWEAWAQSRLQDSQLELALILKNTALPSNPLQKSLAAVFDSLSKELNEKLQQEVRQTLQRPDGPLRYHLRNGLRICELLLPIGVLSWTGYYALQRYMAALNSDTAAFLGFDFLTHSALLTALAWLIPYLARKWLQPSMPKVLRQALLRALTTQLQSTQAQLLDIVQQYQRTANQIGQSAQQLHHSMQTLAQQTHAKISPQPLTNRTLQQAP